MIDTVKRTFLKMWNGLRIFWAMTAMPPSAYDEFLKRNTTGVFSFANNLLACMAIWVLGFAFRVAVWLAASAGVCWVILKLMGR